MWATAPYLKLTHPYPTLRCNSCKSSTGARTIYGKCADGLLPVFCRKICCCFLQCIARSIMRREAKGFWSERSPLILRWTDILGKCSDILHKGDYFFLTSYLFSCTHAPSETGSTQKRNNLLPRVNRGIHYFPYFCSKHRLWVLVRTASSRRF